MMFLITLTDDSKKYFFHGVITFMYCLSKIKVF
jgi:hypothetical protein